MFLAYFFGIIVFIFFGVVVFRGAPYVPSHKKNILQSLTKLYKINKNDVLLDVGSGDGKVLRQASKLGAKAIGYEINPFLMALSTLLSIHDRKVSIKLADFWLTKIPESTTVIYAFVVTRDVKRLIAKVQDESNRLKKSIWVISYGNEFPGKKPANNIGAYFLYRFNPLQPGKAQV